MSTKTIAIAQQLGVAKSKLPAIPFSKVTFYDAAFVKQASPKFSGIAGYLINRSKLDNALVGAAKTAGVKIVADANVTDVRVRENGVTVVVKDRQRPFEGRLLMLASGRGSPLIARCGFRRGAVENRLWTGQLDAELPSSFQTPDPHVCVVLGLDRFGGFGLVYLIGDRMSISIHWAGDADAATSAFVNFVRTAHEKEVIPIDLSKMAASVDLVPSPAAAALDMDTHVGKHALLIGDAGGFVSAASNEGIYPAMWSAQIASAVIDSALKSVYSQDELMAYDSKWRLEMADYLRSPNTDTQFLLPLVFSNQSMADRMAAAFFSGDNI